MNEPAFRLQGITKRYRHFVMEELDLELMRGRTLGLIGHNGAGKSTLLRLLVGLIRADAGRVEVLGRLMPDEERAIKADLGFVSEDMAPYGAATVAWHMAFIRSIHPTWDDTRASALLERLDLDPSQRLRGMSRGQHVKLMMLLCLARRPEMLILDEPTAGLDPLMRHEILDLLREARDHGQTVILSSHRSEDVAQLADEVAFLHRGRLVEHQSAEWLTVNGPRLEQVYIERIGGPEHRGLR